MDIEPERIKQIEARLQDGYYLQHWVEAVSDMWFLLKLYRIEHKKAEKYWDAANKAELELDELKEKGKHG